MKVQSAIRIGILAVGWAGTLAISSAPLSPTIARGLTEPSRPAPAPKAVTPFTSYDFGDVYTGELISQIFVIKNEGDAELQIKEFKGG
ncbi:MAG TPA: hypothetical protein VLM38_00465 [Blastocatellia bacterium]|nr:hypothetical protein [Blastocatellia bacterium]